MRSQKLSSIKKNNPQFSKDDDLVDQFILRQRPYENVIHTLVEYQEESTPQHFLIIGQRGMGKSTLLKRIEIELRRNQELSSKFIPILFPEEVYNVERLSKFWHKALDCTLDFLELTNQNEELQKWEKEVNKLSLHQDENEVYQVFENIFISLGKKPVILIDNINMLFSALDENENWTLRSRLTGKDAPVLISASPTSPDVFSDYHQAFYDYFKIIHLDPVSLDEFHLLVEFWINDIEEINIKNDFIVNKQRLEALFRLSGGNLRTIIMLFIKMADGFRERIDEDLDNLLDEITPLYKARMEELPEQLRNIVDAIALNWDPIDIKMLKHHTGIETHILSPQIKRLRSAGWVSNVESKTSKGDKYEIVERFFNIWHIMRSSTRRSKRAVRGLASFMEIYYGNEISHFAQNLMNNKITNQDQLLIHLASSRAIKDSALRKQLENKIWKESHHIKNLEPYLQNEVDTLNPKHRINEPNEEYIISDWQITYSELIESKNYDACETYLLEKINQFPKNGTLLFLIGYLYHGHLKDYKKAEEAYLKAEKLDPKNSNPWINLGSLYQDHFNEPKNAERAYLNALKIDPKDSITFYNLGVLYQTHIIDYKKAEEAYLKALKLNSKDPMIWLNLGKLYQDNLNENLKAKDAYLKAIKLDPKFSMPWNNLGNLYKNYFKDYKSAEKAYLCAINLDSNDAYPWNNLGNLYQDHLQKYGEAKDAYLNSINLDPKYSDPINNLGNLYQYHLKEYEKAKDLYISAIKLNPNSAHPLNNLGNLYQYHLKEFKKAKDAYLNSIKLDPNYPIAWNNLGNLYQDRLQDYKKAEEAYLKAKDLNEKYADPWNGLGNLYQNHLQDYKKAEDAYLKAIDLDEKYAYPWNNLGNLYQDRLQDYKKAEEAYLKAKDLNEKYVDPWNGLGNLYQYHLQDYKKAEEAYLKAIKLDGKNAAPWNGLGNLYQDYFHDYKRAKEAYINAISINNELIAKYNLVFLLRDKLHELDEAKKIFETIDVEANELLKDSYYLNKSLFHIYDSNFGFAIDSLKKAISWCAKNEAIYTFDDWMRFVVVANKKGFAPSMLEIFKETEIIVRMRPLYEAAVALNKNDASHLNDVAAEVRTVAKDILEKMNQIRNNSNQ